MDGRYPGNVGDLAAAIAKSLQVEPANILLGTGSGEIIAGAVGAFTSPTRALVAAKPTWENPEAQATRMKTPVKNIAVDGDLRIDVAGMLAAAKGSGLVFFCNPNNPTGTVHSKTVVTKFVEDVLAASPETTVLLDEAYYDFVVDPNYATGIPLAMKYPRVIVTPNLLQGSWHGGASRRLRRRAPRHPQGDCRQENRFGQRRERGGGARLDSGRRAMSPSSGIKTATSLEATVRTFKEAGCRVSDSQGNFILADVKRPAKAFREACERMGVLDWPRLPAADQLGAHHDRHRRGNENRQRRLQEGARRTADHCATVIARL